MSSKHGDDLQATQAAVPVTPVNSNPFLASLVGIVTVSDSSEGRLYLMRACEFPLEGDIPAFLIVNQLAYRGSARPGWLADAIKSSPSNVTKIVKRLTGAGLVARVPDGADERAVLIVLTPAGRALARRIVDAARKIVRQTLDGWAVEDVERFESYLERFSSGLPAFGQRPLSRRQARRDA